MLRKLNELSDEMLDDVENRTKNRGYTHIAIGPGGRLFGSFSEGTPIDQFFKEERDRRPVEWEKFLTG